MMNFDMSPLFISLKTSFLATAITFVLGIFAARIVQRIRHFQGAIDAFLTLPLVLPPTVTGFFLLVVLGHNSPIGYFLQHFFNVQIAFSWPATVIAAIVVSFPLMYRAARGAFLQVERDYIDAARTLGMSETVIFFRIILPLSWPGVFSGTVLAFARALGEFGATIMLAGNIPGKTQTMSTAIYQAVQVNNLTNAYIWAAIIAIWSLSVMLFMSFWSRRHLFVLEEKRCN